MSIITPDRCPMPKQTNAIGILSTKNPELCINYAKHGAFFSFITAYFEITNLPDPKWSLFMPIN